MLKKTFHYNCSKQETMDALFKRIENGYLIFDIGDENISISYKRILISSDYSLRNGEYTITIEVTSK
jgi:hypothetical protein